MRVNANALILRDGYVLLVKVDDENGIHYNLPGGKVEKGETLYEGLTRECLEEVGIEVNVKELVLSWEYVPEKENYTYGKKQKLGLVFRCEVVKGSEPRKPTQMDENQVGYEWVSLENVALAARGKFPPIYPRIEKEILGIAGAQTKGIPFLVSG